MMESTLDQIRQITADLFNLPVEQVTAESSTDTIENWDSLQHLNFVLALEQNFGLQFSPEEVERMRTVEFAATLVDEKKASLTNSAMLS